MDDLIRRQDAIDALDKLCDRECEYSKQQRNVMCGACHLGSVFDVIEQLPSAQPEPNYDEWCDDCKEYDHEKHCCPRWNRVIRETLKDAQPERKTGKWMWNGSGYHCSECNYYAVYDNAFYCEDGVFQFCPYCGARMEVEDE